MRVGDHGFYKRRVMIVKRREEESHRPKKFSGSFCWYTRVMENCNKCNSCCDKPKCKDPCGCPMKVLSIETLTDRPGYVKFNLDGGTVLFDFSDVVAETETDTFLRIDQVARVLKYLAEGHTNNISAQQLGSILHIADIGDVNAGAVTDNSLFIYQKNSECGTNCDSIQNQWVAWNANDHPASEMQMIMGFDENGVPKALDTPQHTNQFYSIMWRGADKVGYSQPTSVVTPSTDGTYAHLLFEKPGTHEFEALPVKVEIDNQGVITLKTQGGA